MIEILEHPVNVIIRKRNKLHFKNHEDAEPLITDQLLILVDGHEVGWLNNHPLKKPGVSMMFRVDDEMCEEIKREVERYLGKTVPIGQPPPTDDDTDIDEDEEEDKPSVILTPEGGEDDES